MYLVTLRFFRDTAEDKCRVIIGYYNAEDWTNYTTKVHGLKSSARVIGAGKLSEHARELELAGKSGDLDYIRANHEAVMEEYGSFREILRDC